MHYTGSKKEIYWKGEVIVAQGQMCVLEENKDGVPVVAVGAGKLIPENWVGKRVRVTVKLEEP
jgi:hypothetical protein